MTNRLVLASGALATAATVALAVGVPGFRTTLDLRLYDTLLKAATDRSPPESVALVVVDDASISEVGQWPWPRDALGHLVDTLAAAGARVLAFDILLSEPDRLGGNSQGDQDSGDRPDTDAALVEALREPEVVMGHAFTFADEETLEASSCVLEPLGAVLVQRPDQPPPASGLPRPTGSVCSLPAFTTAAGGTGFLNAEPDPDGILRRVPLLMAGDGQVYPSLALAAAVAHGAVQEIALESEPAGGIRLTLDGIVPPLDEGGALLARYWGGVGSFTEFKASDVLAGRLPEGAVRDRVVFIGATALGLRDVVATPFASSLPGIEVHATVAANILEGEFMRIPTWAGAFAFLGIVLGGLGVTVLAARIGLPLGGAIGMAGVGLLWFAAFKAAAAGVFFSPVLPTLAVVLAVSSMTVLRLRDEGGRADEEKRLRERANEFTIQSLTGLTATRDQSTGEHARRTGEYVAVLGAALAEVPAYRSYLTPDVVEAIAHLAPLHDIGKVGVADSILQKPGPLTDDEYAEMKTHPELGFQTILRAERAAGLTDEGDQEVMRLAKEIVHTHHERWDGKGYPQGLSGEDIPIPGRIMAVVDVYDALVGVRVYQGSMTHEQASAIITEGRGTSFDPAVVDAFYRVEDEFRRIADRSRETDSAEAPSLESSEPS